MTPLGAGAVDAGAGDVGVATRHTQRQGLPGFRHPPHRPGAARGCMQAQCRVCVLLANLVCRGLACSSPLRAASRVERCVAQWCGAMVWCALVPHVCLQVGTCIFMLLEPGKLSMLTV